MLACLESFLESNGIRRTQEDMIAKYDDLWKVVQDGKVLKGTISIGMEKELFEPEGVLFDRVGSISDISDLARMHAAFQNLNSNESFIIGITHHVNQMHSVLFDSINYNFDIWVMDPDAGYKILNKDYAEIVLLIFYRITFHPLNIKT
jgi:hypothetical protein